MGLDITHCTNLCIETNEEVCEICPQFSRLITLFSICRQETFSMHTGPEARSLLSDTMCRQSQHHLHKMMENLLQILFLL